jgi:hypothetical protein
VNEPVELLDAECRAFGRYLTGREPSESVRRYYAGAHRNIPYLTQGGVRPVDRWLLAAARRGGFLLRAADGYARFFRPAGPLRQKLILCLAILENSPETHSLLNGVETGTPALLLSRLVLTGMVAALALGTGILLFGPGQLLSQPDAGSAPRG